MKTSVQKTKTKKEMKGKITSLNSLLFSILNFLFPVTFLAMMMVMASCNKDNRKLPDDKPARALAEISVGDNHTLIVMSDGTLWGWGSNQFGKIGDGTIIDRNTPVQIGTDEDWATVSAGPNHSVALKTDGTLWTWGRNDFGQLGNGASGNGSSVPILADEGRINWATIHAGVDFTMGLKTDGRLFAWGMNNYGQLGDGTTTNKSTPEQVGIKWKTVSAGGGFTVAISPSGVLFSWGLNEYGQLGNGTTQNIQNGIPNVGIDREWQMVSAGANHTVALKTDGTLFAWGKNSDGQLGDGANANCTEPAEIGTGWKYVSAGTNYTAALKTDGSLWAWGANNAGQLGDGTAESKNAPVKIGTDWKTVLTGNSCTAGVKTDGTLWMWGANSNGQLGNGNNTDCHTPCEITLP